MPLISFSRSISPLIYLWKWASYVQWEELELRLWKIKQFLWHHKNAVIWPPRHRMRACDTHQMFDLLPNGPLPPGARQSEQIWHCRFSSYHGHEKETYICGWIIQNNKQHCHWDWADVLLLLLTMIRTRQSALACTLIKGKETVTSLPPIYKLLPLNSYLSADNNLKEYQAHEPYM